ncbi:MAG: hypothetical protein HY904_19625 [Deltaproteobacteria bacterium]|nr:hypothetical protein [Deltaproteobacteria bacterium]
MPRWTRTIPVALRAMIACLVLLLGGGVASGAPAREQATEYRVPASPSTTTPAPRMAVTRARVVYPRWVPQAAVTSRDMQPWRVHPPAPNPVPVYLRHCALLR